MQCPGCRHDNRAGAKFCDECGGPLPRACPACGAAARPSAKFCDLEVTNTPPERARVYVQKFSLPFPYLCDPDFHVRRAFSLDARSHGIGYYAKMMYLGMTMSKPPSDYAGEKPKLAEMASLLVDEDMGFFIVDKQGIVRYALGGTYLTEGGMRTIPSNDEILRKLDRCQQPPRA